MKKSSAVNLGLLSALAAVLTSCGPGEPEQKVEVQRCVNQYTNTVVDDKDCEEAERARRSGNFGYYPFMWYYGGRGYTPGSAVSGGSYTPTPGFSGVRASSPTGAQIIRGGFGSGMAGRAVLG